MANLDVLQTKQTIEARLYEGNHPDLTQWLQQIYSGAKDNLNRRDSQKLDQMYQALPFDDLPPLGDIDQPSQVDIVALYRAQQERRKLLLAIGNDQLQAQGLSIDILTSNNLQKARAEVAIIDEEDLDSLAKKYLLKTDIEQKFRVSPEGARREMIALAYARYTAEQQVIESAAPQADTSTINKYTEAKTIAQVSDKKDSTTQFGTHSGEKEVFTQESLTAPLEQIFSNVKPAAIDVDDWITMPVKPLLVPDSRREIPRDPHGLAEFVWTKLLYSPQFVDRNGKEVAMSDEAMQKHIAKVESYIAAGVPIQASEYTPLIAIPNPLKRRTQSVDLADIDFMRRLASVAKAVEMYYEPGVQWQVINEVPAPTFIDAFGLDPNYVDWFHSDMKEVVGNINATYGRDVIQLTRMDDYLIGNEQRRAAWEAYKKTKTDDMRQALADSDHPDHDAMVNNMAMFTYPMSTCINPFQFEVAQQMPLHEVVQTYEALKQLTGSEMRGVGMANGAKVETINLNPRQQELLQHLKSTGETLAFTYRLTMGAREVLPAFAGVNDTLKYTMVTKKDKPVLFPNSRRGPSFPAHGEPIIMLDDRGQTTVTVKPWITVLANRRKYNNTAYISRNTDDMLYLDSNSS